jgi:hypothetical protein
VTRWTPPTVEAAALLSLDKVTEIRLAVGGALRWKEHQLAGMWVGKAIASVLGLDPDDPADKTKIKKVIKELIKRGALKTVPGRDSNSRREATFVVATFGGQTTASEGSATVHDDTVANGDGTE